MHNAKPRTLPQQVHLDGNGIGRQLHPPQSERFKVIKLLVKDHILHIANTRQVFEIAQALGLVVGLPKRC